VFTNDLFDLEKVTTCVLDVGKEVFPRTKRKIEWQTIWTGLIMHPLVLLILVRNFALDHEWMEKCALLDLMGSLLSKGIKLGQAASQSLRLRLGSNETGHLHSTVDAATARNILD